MKTFRLLLLFGAVLLWGRFAWAEDYGAVTPTGFGFGIGVWSNPFFSASTHAGPGGTQISLPNNLGFKNQSLLVPHIWYRWSHGQILDVRYQQYQATVTATLSQAQTFEAINFPSSQPTLSSFKLQWADISYEHPIAYDTYPPYNSYLNAMVVLKALRGTFSMTNSLGQTGFHSPIMVPVPLLGFHGQSRLLRDTTLEFRAAGIQFGMLDTISYAYDLEAGMNIQITDWLGVNAKYRYSSFYNRDSENNSFGYRFYGPQMDANFRF